MRKKRIKLRDRLLPDYTRGEEIFNMVTHIVGAAFGIVALSTCVVKAFLYGDAYQIVGAFIYGFAMIVLYTMSSIYHGLKPPMAKKVFQVIDHCSIFILIAGTYTPITLTVLREGSPALGWTIFGIVWGVSALGITLNAIDLEKYSVFSMICYLTLGWCIILPGKYALSLIPKGALVFLLIGGAAYTIGTIFYGIASKKGTRYMHSIFHIFVVIGSILHYFSIILYILG
ncbi:MAG: hemolysin III family protein [Ruminococcaceae bacterium]|nr:hemolysin III family protein [Oscillospiraceae bacterium]